jgi:hypothetical protein
MDTANAINGTANKNFFILSFLISEVNRTKPRKENGIASILGAVFADFRGKTENPCSDESVGEFIVVPFPEVSLNVKTQSFFCAVRSFADKYTPLNVA